MFSATKSFFTNEATGGGGGPTPSWSLDFSTGTPSGYTLTRASSGTYVDSSGYIASASTDIARLTHNSSGSRLGLLVEEQRTNILQRSEEFNNAYWTTENLTISANNAAAPDNQTTADRFVETSATAQHGLYRPISGASGWQSMTLFAKAQQRDIVWLQCVLSVGRITRLFDLTNGTVGSVEYTGTASTITNEASIENFGNGWYRLKLAFDANGASFVAYGLSNSATPAYNSNKQPEYAGNTANGALFWGAQFENNRVPSSYIPTTTASVTRSADLAHVLDSSITSWGDPGALVVHFYPPGQAGTLISTDDASTAQVGIEASTTTAARAFWSSGSTSTGTIGTGVQKAVHYWTGSTSKFCINAGTVQSGTNNLTIANTDFVTLGAEATESGGVPGAFSQYANCVIRKVEFYSGTLTDANLQTITT